MELCPCDISLSWCSGQNCAVSFLGLVPCSLFVDVLLPSSVPVCIYKSGAVTFFISASHLIARLGRHC